MKKLNNLKKQKPGFAYLAFILVMSSVLLIFAGSLIAIAQANIRLSGHHQSEVSSMDVAEAGVNYYLWHLSHNNKDYCDGNACSGNAPYGPYTHDYTSTDGRVAGSYALTVTPPNEGASMVTVVSVGKLDGSNVTSTVTAQIGMPSFAAYSFLTNTECWFGVGEQTNGSVHSNIGIHYDGTANGIVSSSSQTYTPSSSFGGDGKKHDGVWGTGGPTSFWTFPVPSVNFNQVSVDLNKISQNATANGIVLPQSNKLGYYLKLKSNNTIDVYKVTKETATGITTTFVKNYNAPANGVLYTQDYLWIDGTWNGKITIATSSQSSSQSSITITNNLTYLTKDGTNKIGLVAVGDIEVAPFAPSTLEIDGAMLSQKGHVWYVNGGPIKDSILIYGAIATYDYWTWTWVSGNKVTSGYNTTTQTYDTHFTLDPPVDFPTTGNYNVLSWKEN